ncbi:MAG: hypothetical protein LBM60_04785, partial [Clostridium sp.]|nr:hypothetical protein [Clostridium sp.]
FSNTILEEVAVLIDREQKEALARCATSPKKDIRPSIYYGDVYKASNGNVLYASPKITGFTCYRNIPCHQAIFYDEVLFSQHLYQARYRIRGDYEHFLWCFYREKARMIYLNRTIATYEGGGFSEKRENRKLDLEEHQAITRKYMKKSEIFRYELLLVLTLRSLRKRLASNHTFTKVYEAFKKRVLYRKERIR